MDDEMVLRLRLDGKLLKAPKRFKLIDLFAGAGGLSAGFSEMFGHSFIPVWANDFNEYAAKTYSNNFGIKCHTGDIVDFLNERSDEIPKADVVIGGPPCQGFSLLNKNRDSDSRKQLWRPFLEVVKLSGAKVFVMENVPQLLGSLEHRQIENVARGMGFKLAWGKLCSADYGAPQKRWRAFIVGCSHAEPTEVFPPRKTHLDLRKDNGQLRTPISREYVADIRPWMTVRNAIGDLPQPEGTELRTEPPPLNLHFGRTPTRTSLKRYEAIPKEGMNRFDLQKRAPELTPRCWIKKKTGGTDLFGRLWWDRPAFTIRTEFFKPEKGRYLHPEQNRPITHREAARFQSFPDSFNFSGTKIEIAKQIGNAVPSILAARIADVVFCLLNRSC
jgi:DNA (cytosine-5)-methyltransferase 1